MNSTPHDPAYRAAVAQTQADIREIGDILSQLLVRQKQLTTALDALTGLVDATEANSDLRAAHKAVFEMSSRAPRTAPPVDQVKIQALA